MTIETAYKAWCIKTKGQGGKRSGFEYAYAAGIEGIDTALDEIIAYIMDPQRRPDFVLMGPRCLLAVADKARALKVSK